MPGCLRISGSGSHWLKPRTYSAVVAELLGEVRQPGPDRAREQLEVQVLLAHLPELGGGVREVAVGEDRLGAGRP